MPEKMLLVVQAPNRGGQRGHQYLVAQVDPKEFDLNVWMKGKSDSLIIMLGKMREGSPKQLRSPIEMRKYVQHLVKTRQANDWFLNVQLDFALPTKPEVMRAEVRWKRVVQEKRIADHALIIAKLQQTIDGCLRYIASTNRKLGEHRAYLKQSNLLSGVRLHYTRALIPDLVRDLRWTQKELRTTQTLLRHAQKKLLALESEKE